MHGDRDHSVSIDSSEDVQFGNKAFVEWGHESEIRVQFPHPTAWTVYVLGRSDGAEA